MEQLLLILFVLFSVVSALMERRKRRRQLEEAQQRQDERRERGSTEPEPAAVEEEDGEEWGGWPFPSGDPFERPEPKPVQRQETADSMPPVTADAQSLLRELEQQANAAEELAEAQAAAARERQRQAARPARSVAELMRQRRTAQKADVGKVPVGGRYHLTPEKARDAVVYAELLGPCKAEREEEWRW
jgi:hypothetical protein